ncbi:GvpL/GvpF family gas vesicle protein [Candidatus Poribacteria bacterium]|nr:GvpL/GvpF family gas vesicle protein [Candidatus Poribacteria bacterium]
MNGPFLVYGVIPTKPLAPPVPSAGVEGLPVELIENDGIGAAVSRIHAIDPALLTPEIGRVLAYEKVIEALHRLSAVLPMRYGCVMKSESHVTEFLSKRGQDYQYALTHLEGCSEYAIRILLPRGSHEPPNGGRSIENRDRAPCPPESHSGRMYLKNRKEYYALKDQSAEEETEAVERCRAAFAQMYVEWRSEYSPVCPAEIARKRVSGESRRFRVSPAAGTSLVSLYFLVAREMEQSFIERFRRLCDTKSAKMLMTGPWPPYNFVPRM